MRESLSRTVVVRAARSLLSSDGPGGLSLRGLAARLNVTAAALYAYVDNKGDLLQAVLEHEVDALNELFAAQQQVDPVERLCAISRAYTTHACGNAPIFRTMFLPRAEKSSSQGAPEFALMKRAFGVALGPIMEGMEQGLLRDQEPHLAHQTLWTAVHGTTAVLLLSGMAPQERALALAQSVIDTVVRGMCTEAGILVLERTRMQVSA